MSFLWEAARKLVSDIDCTYIGIKGKGLATHPKV